MTTVPIDVCIYLALAGIVLGALVAFALAPLLRRKRRIGSAAFFHERDAGQAVPFWNEWSPQHGEWAAHLNASRRQH